jgi:hypothetical protein
VDDELRMGVEHSPAHVLKKSEPLINGQVVGIAIRVNGLPLDVLHGEVGLAFISKPAIEQAGDVGMLEPCQDLPFRTKPLQDRLGIHTALNELEGHLLLELAVGPMRQKNAPHAPMPEFTLNLVRPDAAAFADGFIKVRNGIQGYAIEEAVGVPVFSKQRPHFLKEGFVLYGSTSQVRFTLFRRDLAGSIK